MNAERWRRIKPLLEHALELDATARAAYVAALEGEHADLRDDLARLLAEQTTGEADLARRAQALSPSGMAALVSDPHVRRDRVGEQLGTYRLLRLLGAGGMGTVYLAERRDGGFAQQVALKIVESAALDAQARDRFDREREIIARLRHPGIASLYDGGDTPEGVPYYTMELVEGLNLWEYCRDNVGEVEDRVALLVEVGKALAYAHQNLIVHRDIKPSNILVTSDRQPKLLDFGIAKLLNPAPGATMTQAPLGPMTPEYAAPEQFRGGAITVATDIFQFGTLCYRLLSGQLPYRADPTDTFAWARAVSEDEPISLSRAIRDEKQENTLPSGTNTRRWRRRLGGDLDAIVRKALQKNPEQRYASMDAMLVDLEAFLEGRPVSARRAGPGYFAWKWISRRPYVSAGAAVALIALVATTIVALAQARIARNEAEHAGREAQRADQTSDFLISLFKVSDPGVNRGERLNANQILARGAERIEKEFAGQPEHRARLEASIADVYSAMGDYPRARPLLESAVATLRGPPAADAASIGHSLRQLAWVYSLQNEYDRALKSFDEAEAILAPLDTPSANQDLVWICMHRGITLLPHGDFKGAGEQFEHGLEIARRAFGDDSEMAGIAHHYIGVWLYRSGKLSESLHETEQALKTFQHVFGENHPRTLSAEANLGILAGDLNELKRARSVLADTAEREKRVLGDSNISTANTLASLGWVELHQEDYDNAFAHFEAGETAFRAALGDRDFQLAGPILGKGAVLLARREYAAALDAFERCRALYRDLIPENEPDMAILLMYRADALLGLARAAEALADASEAVAILRKKPSPDPLDLPQVLIRLGVAHKALGHSEDAREALREASAIVDADPGSKRYAAASIRAGIAQAEKSPAP